MVLFDLMEVFFKKWDASVWHGFEQRAGRLMELLSGYNGERQGLEPCGAGFEETA